MRRRDVPPAQGIEVPLSGVLSPTLREVRHRGARYVLAQEPAHQEAENAVNALVKGLKEHAEKLFRKAGVQHGGVPAVASSGPGDEKEGVEIKYNLKKGNFSGIEAFIYIDYLVKGKNAMGEDANWWEALTSRAQEMLRSKEEQQAATTGNYNVNQMVFRFCKGNHAATPNSSPKIGQLLETIGFLQGTGDLVTLQSARNEGTELADEDEEDDIDSLKLMFGIMTNFAGKVVKGFNKDVRYPAAKELAHWGDVDKWGELLGELVNNKKIPQPNAQQLYSAIGKMSARGQLADNIKNLDKLVKKPAKPKSMESPGGVREVMKTKLATIINQGPYRINYTAWDRMGIANGEKVDGKETVVLKIAAPMKPYFTFIKGAGGAPQLHNASCLLCGRVFSSVQGDEAAAGRLAWTGVILGRGAALGINPVEVEHPTEQAWITNILEALPKAEPETTQQAGQAPAGQAPAGQQQGAPGGGTAPQPASAVQTPAQGNP